MEIKDAKNIIGTIALWNMYMMGVAEKPKVELSKDISLEDLIKANKMVAQWNIKQREKPSIEGNIQQLTCDDKLLAAVYVATHYNPNKEVVAVMNNVGIGCVKIKN